MLSLVTFSEDFPAPRGGNAPVNNFLITSARFVGYRTIPTAQRTLCNQLYRTHLRSMPELNA